MLRYRARCNVTGRELMALVIAMLCLGSAACARTLARTVTPSGSAPADALLVLPGFGYGRAGADAIRAVAPAMAADGIDLFVPTYIARGGLADSREQLRRFIREQQLERYRRLHVFAFIAGAWTVNPIVEAGELPNLATIVYDRSPLQERAPRIADEQLHVFTWIRYGSPVFDVARTPYPPLTREAVKVALLVETVPTAFVKRHAGTARSYGPLRFECDALAQRHDDCAYLALAHGDMYRQFASIWPEVRSFIQTGRLTAGAIRTPPAGDAFVQAWR